ncbi:MAG: hypothetical protein P8Y01_10080 [Woeseiaceae bacterium]
MSKRILISLILALSAGTAAAGSGEPGTTKFNPTIKLGDGSWLLYRPLPREVRVYDFDFMMARLRSTQTSLGLRFTRSTHFRLDLTLAPLTDRRDYIGPITDMEIGATRLVLSFTF